MNSIIYLVGLVVVVLFSCPFWACGERNVSAFNPLVHLEQDQWLIHFLR